MENLQKDILPSVALAFDPAGIGPGKSTILQILAGYLQPTAGRLPADPAATIPITVRKRRFPALIATIFRTVNLESIMRETPGYLAVNR
jgi:ABC-type uncharacterized transport system ATPase component